MPTVLVYRALGLGDFLTAVPAYRAIAHHFAGHQRVLAAPRWLWPLIPLVATDLFHDAIDTRPFEPLPPQCNGADVAINLHGRGPQSHRVLLATQPQRLIAFAHADVPESADGAPFVADEHEVVRWCRLLAYAGIAADARALDLEPPAVIVPRRLRNATLLHPGASSEARRWPVERWIALARAEQHAGRGVVVTGGTEDVERAKAIAAGAGVPRSHVVAGRTTVPELAAIVAHAGRVVCGDTGVAHLATAYRVPSVVLFGPVPPHQWGPPAERPWHRALWSGRIGDPHADRPDPGLLQIGVDDVVRALAELAPRDVA